MSARDEEMLIRQARVLLAEGAEPDAVTAARLAAARRRALARARRRPLWAPALAAGAVAATAAWLLLAPGPERLPSAPGELELLLSEAPLELVEELDFYLWLETTEARDAG